MISKESRMKILATIICSLIIISQSSAQAFEEPIDRKRAMSLHKKRQSGEKLNAEELQYLRKAIAALRARRERTNKNRPKLNPTHADVSYGSHPQQAFDLWLAKSKDGKPTPICLFIHGGGFRGGDKSNLPVSTINFFLEKGISFAAINYRLTANGKYPYPIAMNDSARALQTIRSKAKEWNMDKDKVASYGGSAGAGISLWLAFHDDLAQPDSKDPIARESTRLVAAGTQNGQSTYDMRTFQKWFGLEKMKEHSALRAFYNIQSDEDILSERVIKLMEDASPITHLTPDDTPVFMVYSKGDVKVDEETDPSIVVHHVKLGHKLKEAMTKINLECTVISPDEPDKKYETLNNFLANKLLAN